MQSASAENEIKNVNSQPPSTLQKQRASNTEKMKIANLLTEFYVVNVHLDTKIVELDAKVQHQTCPKIGNQLSTIT